MKKKDLVGFITSQVNLSFGGGHSITNHVVKGLLEKNDFYFIGEDRFWSKIFKDSNFQVFNNKCGWEPVVPKNILLLPFSYLKGLLFFLKFYKLLKKTDTFIFNASFTEAFFLAPFIKLFLKNKKIIYTIHGGAVPYVFKKTILGKILKFIWKDDLAIFVSKSQQKQWSTLNLIPKKFEIIYNGISINSFSTKPYFETLETEINFGFIGRLQKEKGIYDLLSALEKIKSTRKIRISIAGENNNIPEITEFLSKLKLPSNISVKWLGTVKNSNKFFSSLDCLIFPTHFESFGLVQVEAWERGVPVICSNIDSLVEIKSFANALEKKLLFKLKNPGDLANKIDYFIENLGIYKDPSYKTNLHKFVKNNFSVEKMIANYEEVLLA